jgi:Ca2+-binding EF-hand superfamily protein
MAASSKHEIPPEEVEMSEVFAFFDGDRDGKIGGTEFASVSPARSPNAAKRCVFPPSGCSLSGVCSY